ncbi:MAG TPA: GFA family protein [Rhodanobacteraceae bacterium]|nr:GFA family protein [Rhodanobacteraceae bacterium]
MLLEGSCHCRRVRFTCEAYAPVPYQRCYCSICRKTAGSGGYAINLGAWKKTLKVEGREHIAVYRAWIEEDGRRRTSTGRRHFCKRCGSALWLYDPKWPELVHPHASAIDTPLPKAPEHVHLCLDFKASWCEVPRGKREKTFARFPKESLADWHRRRGLLDGDDASA